MKNLLISALIFFPITSFSATNSFKCQSIDQFGVHKFDAHGVVNLDDVNNVTGIISATLQKAQSIQSMQNFEDIRVTGFIRHHKAGEIFDEDFDQLVLTTDEPYIKYLNLLLGFKDKPASKIFSIDNFRYRSICKFTN